MSATDWIEDLRAAVWAKIDANNDLSTSNASGVMHNGTKIKFEAGLKKRLTVEPHACPILAIVPFGRIETPSRPQGRGEDTERACVLRVELYGAGPGTSQVTALYAEVVDTFQRALALRPPFGLDDPIREAEFSAAKLASTTDLDDPKQMWVLSFDLAVAFRHGA